jgi:hypothetical protein
MCGPADLMRDGGRWSAVPEAGSRKETEQTVRRRAMSWVGWASNHDRSSFQDLGREWLGAHLHHYVLSYFTILILC